MQDVRRKPNAWRSVLLAASGLLVAVIAATVGAGADASAADDRKADTVFKNGRVLLFPGVRNNMTTSKIGWASAVAVTGDKISYVGNDRGAARAIGKDTRVVNLRGRLMMPSLGDGHLHGSYPPQCNMQYEGGTIDTILGRIKECLTRDDQVGNLSSNFYLDVANFQGDGMLPQGTHLDRHVLDRLSKDPSEDKYGTGTTRPITIYNMDGHKMYVNTKAIENAGLDENTPDPTDGFIGRDPGGYPNGQFADYDADWGPSAPTPPDADYDISVGDVEYANARGITSFLRPGGGTEDLERYKRMADEGKLNVRVNQGLSASDAVRGVTDAGAINSFINEINAERAEYDGYKSPASPGSIAVDTVKIFCDGVPEYPGETAAMIEPYRVNVGTEENPIWHAGTWRGEEPSCEDATLGFVKLDAARWNIHTHSLGDRAARVTLDNIEAMERQNPDWDRRPAISHLEFVDDKDIPRFGELGAIAEMTQQWNRRDAWSTHGIEGYIAPDRMDNMYPSKDIIDGGGMVAQGSDWPVTDLMPWTAIESAVTRTGEVNPAGAIYPGQLNGGDGITLAQAVKTSTIAVAYQMHQDDVTGSIQKGKYADLVIVGDDFFALPANVRVRLDKAARGAGRAKARANRAARVLKRAKRTARRASAHGTRATKKRARARVRSARRALTRSNRLRTTSAKSLAGARAAAGRARAKEVKGISETKVLNTILGGKVIYAGEGSLLPKE